MTTLAPPPPGFPVRDANTGSVWQQNTDGEWTTTTRSGLRWAATWDDLAAGRFGALDMLVPVPYGPDTAEPGTMAARAAVVEGVLQPVATMARQLLDAASAGLQAVMLDVYQQGADAAGDDTDLTRPGPGVPLRTVPLDPTAGA